MPRRRGRRRQGVRRRSSTRPPVQEHTEPLTTDGYFIVFEGPDGSGKTTQARQLVGKLTQKGYIARYIPPLLGTVVGSDIRRTLFTPSLHPTARAETLLFLAALTQLVEKRILPSLEQGEVVICDRFVGSTLAYQGYGHQLSIKSLRPLCQFASLGTFPNMTIYLDLDYESSRRRILQAAQRVGSDGNRDRIEGRGEDYFDRVREGYQSLTRSNPAWWMFFDGSRNIEELSEEILGEVVARIENHRGKGG